MDVFRRSLWIARIERICNDDIREWMRVSRSLGTDIKRRQLIRYGWMTRDCPRKLWCGYHLTVEAWKTQDHCVSNEFKRIKRSDEYRKIDYILIVFWNNLSLNNKNNTNASFHNRYNSLICQWYSYEGWISGKNGFVLPRCISWALYFVRGFNVHREHTGKTLP